MAPAPQRSAKRQARSRFGLNGRITRVGRDQELVICSVSTGAKFMNRDLTFTAEMAGAQCAIVESEVLVRGLREALARTTEVVAVTQQLLWDSGEILRAAKDTATLLRVGSGM